MQQSPHVWADVCIMVCFATTPLLLTLTADRGAAHLPQPSSQVSEVQPFTIMSMHHNPFTTISHTEGETDDCLHFICFTYRALPFKAAF